MGGKKKGKGKAKKGKGGDDNRLVREVREPNNTTAMLSTGC